jgi:hypothetical protein
MIATKKCVRSPPPRPNTTTDLDTSTSSTGDADGPFEGDDGGGEAGSSVVGGTPDARSVVGCITTSNTNPKFTIVAYVVSSKHGVFPVLGFTALTIISASSFASTPPPSQAGVSAYQLGGWTLT